LPNKKPHVSGSMPRKLLDAYPQESRRYDEMLQAPYETRPHWQRLFNHLVHDSPERMRERANSVQRQIVENGVTYNVYADPQGADRPWDLDLLPLILPYEEWQQIEAAIVQRATLLNRILEDVYGEQELLREGLLPPALIYGHAGFLRPCRGIRPPGNLFLHLYAADLARSPDGRWWVIADRTQTPSGTGYALENRMVISRVFPELFRDLGVHHLASFFRTMRDSLAQWAPKDDEPPIIVLLTPGPYNETYFEHAYLARYLGFPLVEGHDLTVRDGCVWLKTLSGLQRVHAILRRLDDDFSDPLELRSDSALGVAGLTEASRRGNVLIANALGTNLAQSGAWLGFLPKLCRRLLGEPLLLPSVATWWCGEPAALESAIDQLGKLVIKPAFPQLRFEPVFGMDLSGTEREELIRKLRARPQDYIAQELVNLSQAPVWDRHHHRRLLARAVGVRVFATASPNGYVVMPGGLTRVASGENARVVSMQRGGGSKDTWVLSHGPVSTFSLLRRAVGPQELVRAGANLSSRVVENLFWFGRYAERCENTARLLRVALGRLIEDIATETDMEWPAIVALCQSSGLLEKDIDTTSNEVIEGALLEAVVDPEHPHGLSANLRHLSRAGFILRERLSVDNWRTLNQLAQDLARLSGHKLYLSSALALLDRSVNAMFTMSGFALDGMTRDQGWRFLSIGRRIERLQFFCLALQRALTVAQDGDLDWLLELADSIITYRSRYMARPEWLPVLDLLVMDESNPRSVMFQVLGLWDYLTRLSEAYSGCGKVFLEVPVRRLNALDIEKDLRPDSESLRLLLADIGKAGFALSEHLNLRFFSHVAEESTQSVAA
jgi:uncharacterized circularly permuted ATP-grasp superfamily protein/uncharacterized alpha-E superfamily protein